MIHGHSYIRRITGRMVATDPEALLAINPEALAQQAKIERFRRKKKIEKIFFCVMYMFAIFIVGICTLSVIIIQFVL